MGIAAQLIERPNRRILSAEISQEESDGSAIGGDGGIPHRRRHRFRRWLEELRQRRRGEGNPVSFHDREGGTGGRSRATARGDCSRTAVGVRGSENIVGAFGA